MDLNRAEAFTRVVECAGFSRAARQLGAPKTTLSKKVADLEAELGVRLLNRTTRSVAPTEAGLRLFRHCAEALRLLGEGEREVRAMQQAPKGMLTVAAPAAIAVHFLMPTLVAFMNAYRDVQITLRSVNDVIEPMQRGVDVLIWAGDASPSGHVVRLVARVEMALYASADYLARRASPGVPQDLVAHDVVAFTQSLEGQRFTWRLQGLSGEVDVVPTNQPRFRSDDPAAILAAIASGQGIGILPVRFAQEVGAGRDLVTILPAWRAQPREVRALIADTSNLKARLFIDLVAEWFRKS